MKICRWMTGVVFSAMILSGAHAVATAQTLPPPVEVSGNVATIATFGGVLPAYGGTFSAHVNRFIALEAGMRVLPSLDASLWRGRAVLYDVGIRGRIFRARQGVDWFLTAGGTGLAAVSQFNGQPVRLFDRWTIDLPSRTDRVLMPPVMPTGGFGVVAPVGRHLAIRADVRIAITPIGPAAESMIGLTVPVGRFGLRR